MAAVWRMAQAAMMVAVMTPWVPASAQMGDACETCHPDQATAQAATGGHGNGAATCVACHADRRPGHVGRHHRWTLQCSRCHQEAGHPVRNSKPTHATTNCLNCHDPHGTANARLILPDVRVRRTRLQPITFTDAGGAVPGGFVSPDASGTGLCEVCHRKTQFWRADAKDAPHFTDRCTLCHGHAVGFQIAIDDSSCSICHALEAQRFTHPSQHSQRFACSGCHAPLKTEPGPGHRDVTPCASCHDNATHNPPGVGALPCQQCHEPHGTTNLNLILEAITTPAGAARPIIFNNVLGREDGSFASASAPGTGICEICHTTTRFYRADGTGESHFTYSCLPCHTHGAGFAPPQ